MTHVPTKHLVHSSVPKSTLLVLVVLIAMGCSDLGTETSPMAPPSEENGSRTPEISYQSQIRPIFQSFGCVSCHGGSGGLTVTTVAQLLKGGDHGPAVVAGKYTSSLMFAKLSSNPPFGSRMPQGGPYLPDSTIQLLARWIDQGAKDN